MSEKLGVQKPRDPKEDEEIERLKQLVEEHNKYEALLSELASLQYLTEE